MSSGYVYRTPILTETKEQSRQRAKDALEKYHFKLNWHSILTPIF